MDDGPHDRKLDSPLDSKLFRPRASINHREAQYAYICLQLLPMQQLIGLHLLHLSWRHSHTLSYTVNGNLHCTRCALRADMSQRGLRYNVQASDHLSLPKLDRMLSQLAGLLICLCGLMVACIMQALLGVELPPFCSNYCLPPALETLWQTWNAPGHEHVLNFSNAPSLRKPGTFFENSLLTMRCIRPELRHCLRDFIWPQYSLT